MESKQASHSTAWKPGMWKQ